MFHDYNFGKMKTSGGIDIFSHSIDNVLKKYKRLFLKMYGNPDI